MPDFQRPGTLSIVVQGGVSAGNLAETANHCGHWRALFPAAEIILAISVTDLLAGAAAEDGTLSDTRLTPKYQHDGICRTALARLEAACDRIVLSAGALPLPPLKKGSGPNNCNLQIEAARAGLAHASGAFTLRIRSDMIFHDAAFLAEYVADYRRPRGAAAFLQERVLICEVYTLNPFTLERMPLHLSDWFHFGLTDDVRTLWQVPQMSLADAIHYELHPYAPHSNALERKFNLRLAIEQHIALAPAARHFPALVLDYHNDPTSIDLAMRILLDNFVVCDPVRARLYFPKYARFLDHPVKPIQCVTAEDWRYLAEHPEVDFQSFYAPHMRKARRRLLLKHEPLMRPVNWLVVAAQRVGGWLRQLAKAGGLLHET